MGIGRFGQNTNRDTHVPMKDQIDRYFVMVTSFSRYFVMVMSFKTISSTDYEWIKPRSRNKADWRYWSTISVSAFSSHKYGQDDRCVKQNNLIMQYISYIPGHLNWNLEGFFPANMINSFVFSLCICSFDEVIAEIRYKKFPLLSSVTVNEAKSSRKESES